MEEDQGVVVAAGTSVSEVSVCVCVCQDRRVIHPPPTTARRTHTNRQRPNQKKSENVAIFVDGCNRTNQRTNRTNQHTHVIVSSERARDEERTCRSSWRFWRDLNHQKRACRRSGNRFGRNQRKRRGTDQPTCVAARAFPSTTVRTKSCSEQHPHTLSIPPCMHPCIHASPWCVELS